MLPEVFNQELGELEGNGWTAQGTAMSPLLSQPGCHTGLSSRLEADPQPFCTTKQHLAGAIFIRHSIFALPLEPQQSTNTAEAAWKDASLSWQWAPMSD